MKFRPHRGTLEEAMKEVVELPATKRALAAYLEEPLELLQVKHYMQDDRIGWDTYIVTINDQAVGFTDGPCH